MYYYRPPYVIYRDYSSYGYLTDNRNFGYDTASKSCLKFGDRILSKNGSVFYSQLSETPCSIEEIVHKLQNVFEEVPLNLLEKDALEFFSDLYKDGFVGCISDAGQVPSYNIFSYKSTTPFLLTKHEFVADSYATYVPREKYSLARVHINLSERCNERCLHCYYPASRRNALMSKNMFLEILKQCKVCNVLNITIGGGEPMLNPLLPFIIKKCRENNFSVNILSNLTLLTEYLMTEFAKTPLLSIQTSLYSMNSVVHDSITNVKGSFKKTKQAIELLRKHNIPLQINCPILKQNKDCYQDVLNWAKSLNIEVNSDYMIFGCFDNSLSNLGCRLGLSEIRAIIENSLANDGSSVNIYKDSDQAKSEYGVCPVCANSLCVSCDGNVYPCEGWQSMVLGNVKESSLYQIWTESSAVDTLRNLTIEKDFPQCAICDSKDYCSICLIRNANESQNGDYKVVNPYFCEIAKIKRHAAKK